VRSPYYYRFMLNVIESVWLDVAGRGKRSGPFMDRSFRAVAYASAICRQRGSFRHGATGRQGGASAVAAAAQSTSARSVVSVDGVTPRSVNIDLQTGIAILTAREPMSSTTTVWPAIPPA
jgi:hypothetical protein